MSRELYLRYRDDSEWQWLLTDSSEEGTQQETGAVALDGISELLEEKRAAQTILLVPADDVAVKKLEFSEAERKHLRKTIPFTLEDDLLDNVDDLHFALGEADSEAGTIDVAVVRNQKMAQWLEDFKGKDIRIDRVFAATSANDEGWSIVLDGDDAQIAAAELPGGHLVVPQSALLETLAIARESHEIASVTVFADNIDAAEALAPDLHNAGIEEVRVSEDVLGQCVQTLRERQAIDLLQGAYSRAIQWLKIWSQWRLPLILLAVTLVVAVGGRWLEARQMAQTELAYRQAIEKSYRSLFPQGLVVNPRVQMNNKLAELRGGGGAGSRFMPMMSALATVQESASLTVNSINYEARNGELRIDVVADNFDSLERIRAAVAEQGVDAELLNSSAQGSRVRAKLRLKEAG